MLLSDYQLATARVFGIWNIHSSTPQAKHFRS